MAELTAAGQETYRGPIPWDRHGLHMAEVRATDAVGQVGTDRTTSQASGAAPYFARKAREGANR
jgi:hypothetical protein